MQSLRPSGALAFTCPDRLSCGLTMLLQLSRVVCVATDSLRALNVVDLATECRQMCAELPPTVRLVHVRGHGSHPGNCAAHEAATWARLHLMGTGEDARTTTKDSNATAAAMAPQRRRPVSAAWESQDKRKKKKKKQQKKKPEAGHPEVTRAIGWPGEREEEEKHTHTHTHMLECVHQASMAPTAALRPLPSHGCEAHASPSARCSRSEHLTTSARCSCSEHLTTSCAFSGTGSGRSEIEAVLGGPCLYLQQPQ